MTAVIRGASPAIGGALPISGTQLVRIRCPHCRALIPPPFMRARVAISNTHPNPRDLHGPRCRVVVVPDPVGEQHQVYAVPERVTIEDVMHQVSQLLESP